MIETWLSGDSSPNVSELERLIDALDQLKSHACQKLQGDAQEEREPSVPTRILRNRDVDLRPSKRRRNSTERGRTSNTKRARFQSDSLFINENEPDFDSDQTEEIDYGQESHVSPEKYGRTPTHFQSTSSPQFFNEVYDGTAEQTQLTERTQLNGTIWESNEPVWEPSMGGEQGSGGEQSVRLPSPAAALPTAHELQPSSQEDLNEEFEAVAEPINGENGNREAIEQASSTDITQYRMQLQRPSSAELDVRGRCSLERDLLLDPGSPRYFDEAFGERFGHEYGTAVDSPAVDATEPEYPPQNFANDPEFLPHLELACRMGFCLPQEHTGAMDETSVRERLSPLLEEKPLNTSLLHGLLYTVLPGPLRIFELGPTPSDDDFPRPEELSEWFVAILPRSEERTTLLLLGDPSAKVLRILANRSVSTPELETFRSLLPDWQEECIDVRTRSSPMLLLADPQPFLVQPRVESMLLSVFLAETCVRGRLPVTEVPSSRDLRLRYLTELLAPYERDCALESFGIPRGVASSEQIDTRVVTALPDLPVAADVFPIPDLEHFDMEALRKAFLEKPAGLKRARWLRILQCVNEIGSPHILDSLKLVLNQPVAMTTAHDAEQPIVEKLMRIHLYLEGAESQSHLDVARSRYVKYCYFETYERAVKALRERKRASLLERRRLASRKHCVEVSSAPYTDDIEQTFQGLTEKEKKRKTEDVIKTEIARRMLEVSCGDEKQTRQNITRYIREGKVLHYILQGALCLNPSILILFPSWESQPPTLAIDAFQLKLEHGEKTSLSRPIERRE